MRKPKTLIKLAGLKITKKDIILISWAYLSMPISWLIINSTKEGGLFLEGEFIFDIGHLIYCLLFAIGVVLPVNLGHIVFIKRYYEKAN